MPAMVIARNRRVLTMNSSAQDVLGVNGTGGHYSSVLRQPAVTDAIEATLADNTPRQARLTALTSAREDVYKLDITSLDDHSNPGILVVFADVSGADSLGQMRRNFVANVSHELRTPLTALMGFIETLRGPAKDDVEARENFLQMMQGEAERMSRLVADLLSLSQVEVEARVRPDQRVNLADLVQNSAPTILQLVGREPDALTISGGKEAVWISGDRDQLSQVLRNLIENAFKYGAKRVDLKITLLERDAGLRRPAVALDVIDDGEGIDALHLPRLTERFYRVDSHRSRARGGTGLGLAIVKHIIDRHRGRLRIKSEKGQGSVFSVILPRQ